MRPPLAAFLLLASAACASAETPSVMERWTVVDGMRIRSLEVAAVPGAEDAPPLVMLAGWTGSADDWVRLLPLLPGPHAIAVDWPGCGISDKPDAAYDLEFYLGFLRGWCAARGITRFVMVAHSMGAQIGLHFASRWPGMVERIVLVAPDGLAGEEGGWLGLTRAEWLVNLGFRLNTRLFIRWALLANVLYKPDRELLDAAVESAARGILDHDGARAIARTTTRLIGHDPVDGILPSIGQEVLLIWGTEDRLLKPPWAEKYASLLPRVRLEWVAESGHEPMLERPRETAALVASFLGQPAP